MLLVKPESLIGLFEDYMPEALLLSVNESGRLYTELVPEIGQESDYDSALNIKIVLLQRHELLKIPGKKGHIKADPIGKGKGSAMPRYLRDLRDADHLQWRLPMQNI